MTTKKEAPKPKAPKEPKTKKAARPKSKPKAPKELTPIDVSLEALTAKQREVEASEFPDAEKLRNFAKALRGQAEDFDRQAQERSLQQPPPEGQK